MNTVLFFKALADETRLRIINLLKEHELNVNELVSILEMGQSRISRHLKILADAEIISPRRDGLWCFYSLVPDQWVADFFEQTAPLFRELGPGSGDLERCELIIRQRTRETRQLFNSLAGNWARIKADIFGPLDLNHEILKAVTAGSTIVDIGCGTGDLLKLLAATRAGTIIGVDNSPGMLEQAALYLQDAADRIDLRLGNIEHLPLGDREAGTAVINMVLHHFASPVEILKETNRVLATGGQLILVDFKKHSQEVMREKYGDRRLGFEPAELEAALQAGGFRIRHKQIFPLAGGLEILFYITTKEVTI